jgi:hypothetical protein
MRKAGNGLLDVAPVEVGGGNAGFKQNSRTTFAPLEHVELMAAADIDPSSGGRKAPAITMSADQLIKESRGDDGCRQRDDRENNIHRGNPGKPLVWSKMGDAFKNG